jgi:uncharacterized integral membrane protein
VTTSVPRPPDRPTDPSPGTPHHGPPGTAGVTRPQPTTPPRRTARGVGMTLAAALLVFVTVVLVLFVLFNTQTVGISLVFADVEAPLVLALVTAAVLGGLVVGLAELALHARRKQR